MNVAVENLVRSVLPVALEKGLFEDEAAKVVAGVGQVRVEHVRVEGEDGAGEGDAALVVAIAQADLGPEVGRIHVVIIGFSEYVSFE